MSAADHTNEVLTKDRLPVRFHTFKVMVLVTGILLSLGLAYFVRGWETAINQAEFEFLAGTHASGITKEVERHIDLMSSLVGLYSASSDVQRGEFGRFVGHHLALHTDLQMIAWVPRVSAAGRDVMEAAARRDGLAGFGFTELDNEGRFVPAARRDGYFPVYFAEPQSQNSHLFGYDLASDPAMRRHLEQARDSGTWVSADKIVFDDGGREQYGAMLVQPVYVHDTPLATVAQRREHLQGYLLEVFRIGDMIEEALRSSSVRDIDIWVYDENAARDQRFLYRYSDSAPAGQEELEADTQPVPTEMSWRTTVEVGGLHWSLAFAPTPAYLARHVLWRAWAVLGLGCLLSTLLYLYLRVLAARTRHIEQLAIELGATNKNLEHEIAGRQVAERDRKRLAAILEATTDFVCITDARGFILYVNQAALDLLGVADTKDLIGKHASSYHPATSITVLEYEAIPLIRKGRIWSGETSLLTRDGREIPVSQVLLPHMSPAGELEYTSTIIRDITKRKQVEAALQQEIRERRQIEAAIREVSEVVASATGDAFFRMLVKRLTEILNVDCAFIGEIDEEDRGMVQTVAVCLRGEIKENFRYRLHGTPSKVVLDDGLCFYERGVSRGFPADRVLQDLAVESYFGISLLDYSGRPMGVVTVMSCAAMNSRQPAEAILQIYAARVAAELQHKKSHARILDLVKFPDETPSPVLRIRHDGVMLYANQGSLEVVTAWDCWPGGRVPARIHELCLAALEQRAVSEVDLPCGDKIFSFLLAPSSESGYVSCYGRDITERLRADAQMRKLSGALEQAADSVMITDAAGRIEYVNPAFSAMTGYSRDEAIGRRPDIVKSDRHDADFFHRLWDALNAGRVFQDIFVNRKKDGTLYYEEKTITPLKDAAGAVTHFISNGKDITERMQAEERLHRLAYHDVLTGLPNRALFMERLVHALSRKGRNRQLAVMFLDMDQFKTINDTLGHDVGDQLLQAFPERIAGCIRQSDTIARFGGDEFAILLEDITAAEAVGQIAAKIIERLAQPFVVGTHELFVTTSIGVSLYPDDSGDVYTLLKHADSAMYRAKELGRNTYQFYSQEMSTKAYERLSLETSLRHALNRGEFELYYQPQVDLASGRVIGAEALIRWIHPEMGIISPEKFIPLLEETGMIVPVGNWVLRSACERLREWQGYGAQPLRMSVNLSGRQFHDLGFKDQIAAIIQRSGVDPGLLELEITESVLMQNDKVPMQNLHALLGLGLHFAIDDFGTGYSSLSYLKRFPVHTIKIDRSFVHDITVNSDDATIVNTIIVMAHSLKLAVVAEGVETPEQLAFLRRCGCDLIQGYLFSPPLTAAEMKRLLIEGRGLELTSAA